MPERFNFEESEKSLPQENVAASEISIALEDLAFNNEFASFIETGWQIKKQWADIPYIRIDEDNLSEALVKSGLFPKFFTMENVSFALNRDRTTDDWLMSVNFQISSQHFRCLTTKDGFVVREWPLVDEESEPKTADLGNELLLSMANVLGYDYLPSLEKMKESMSTPEIAEVLLETLSSENIAYQEKSTDIINCSEDYKLRASLIDTQGMNWTATDVVIDIMQDFGVGNDKLTLLHRYKTNLCDSTDLRTSTITRQLIDGVPEDFDFDRPSVEPPQEIDPDQNFEAWKKFMQIAEQSLSFAMREI